MHVCNSVENSPQVPILMHAFMHSYCHCNVIMYRSQRNYSISLSPFLPFLLLLSLPSTSLPSLPLPSSPLPLLPLPLPLPLVQPLPIKVSTGKGSRKPATGQHKKKVAGGVQSEEEQLLHGVLSHLLASRDVQGAVMGVREHSSLG